MCGILAFLKSSGLGNKETKDAYKVAQQDMEPEPLTSEVEAAIKDLKAGKSPGLDNIPAEIIKNSGEMGIKALEHHLCCQIWKQQEWPEDWKLQEFVMLYKNGNSKECGNYRTIALISHASKILLIIILNRMKCKVEEELSDCQAGYRANRGTTDMLFVLQIIIEKNKRWK
ncbi:endonuclease-reverse transcriptase [Elysia marginata]|uniref:Endonuclease-reverse transcriptase n=1 Tax=Elysia marginata TaxID=1093978 RepID=A0AAV4HQN5_9GAST|nr:endonuclease-reverse transcriptase [Elysia marginata]